MPDRSTATTIEEARPFLLGLAYRMLGSRADAEDAVQDTFLKWQTTDMATIENPAAWLTAVCTRRCIDLLRSAHRTRVAYVGPWLPEPIHTPTDETPEAKLLLASSLTTAFLLLLERLTPKERAAYLLHEIFDTPYADVATILNIQENACRKLVARGRASISQSKVRHSTPVDRQEQLLAAFRAAVAGGGTDHLAALLSDDVELCADSAGKVPAVLNVLHGKTEVTECIARTLRPAWSTYRWVTSDLNGGKGFILHQAGVATASVSFAYDEEGKLTNIYIMRNPDKLSRLSGTAVS